MKKKILLITTLFILSIIVVKAIDAPPGTNQEPSYDGATTIEKATKTSNTNYSSTTSLQNALLVKGNTSTLESPNIKKTGDANDETADFYGTNAAVLTINEAVLHLEKATISTNGRFANGVFAYGTGVINVNNSKIVTRGNNSGGIMVAGGGKITANNNTVATSGNSSAAIRSDRGGGDITVEGGTYKTTGVGSPAIYSTAYISTENTTLESNGSEGIVVEGANSVDISNSTLTANNTKLNGNSETYKAIFLYQSMSGDAKEGTSSFKAEGSTITNKQGDLIFVTNTTCEIELNNNTIKNEDKNGVLLRIQSAKWGKQGSNGGKVKFTLSSQEVEGDIVVDKISSLDMFVSTNSLYKGAINKDKKGKVKLSVSSESNIILQGDSYVDSLDNANKSNTNIYANGHKLYVSGKEVKINNNEYGKKVQKEEKNEIDQTLYYYVGGGIMAFLLLLIIIILVSRKKAEQKRIEQEKIVQLPMMDASPKSVNEVYKNIIK